MLDLFSKFNFIINFGNVFYEIIEIKTGKNKM